MNILILSVVLITIIFLVFSVLYKPKLNKKNRQSLKLIYNQLSEEIGEDFEIVEIKKSYKQLDNWIINKIRWGWKDDYIKDWIKWNLGIIEISGVLQLRQIMEQQSIDICYLYERDEINIRRIEYIEDHWSFLVENNRFSMSALSSSILANTSLASLGKDTKLESDINDLIMSDFTPHFIKDCLIDIIKKLLFDELLNIPSNNLGYIEIGESYLHGILSNAQEKK